MIHVIVTEVCILIILILLNFIVSYLEDDAFLFFTWHGHSTFANGQPHSMYVICQVELKVYLLFIDVYDAETFEILYYDLTFVEVLDTY